MRIKYVAKRGGVVIACGVMRVLSRTPLAFNRALGRFVGRLCAVLLRKQRRLAMSNLDLAYRGKLNDRTKRRIVRGVFENAGIVVAEFPKLHLLARQNGERLVDVKGAEFLEPGRGAILVSSHMGNWEWMAPSLAGLGIRVAEVVNTYRDEVQDRWIDEFRRRGGISTIPKDGAIMALVKLLAEGTNVGLLCDQSPKRNALPVTFFGHGCWTSPGPALLALRTRAPVHYVAFWRRPDGRYALEVSPRIEFQRTGDIRDDALALTQIFQDHIERAVRAHPEQWLWTYPRWKDRPRARRKWEQRFRSESAA